jgi:alpha-soluble NSF attachment protein
MSEEQARNLLAEASKLAKPGMLGFGGRKYDEAADSCKKAANIYKMLKKNSEAGDAFVKAADFYLLCGSKHEAATCYIDAANCHRKTSAAGAVQCLSKAIGFYAEEGRWSMAARQQKEIAEIYEKELDLDNAIEAYQKAADFYEGENSVQSANQCLLQVGLFSAQKEKYDRAIKIFDQLATTCLDNNLTKWNFRDHALRAVLCHLCNTDVVASNRALEKYSGLDPSFATSREAKLLDLVIKAVEGHDPEAFTNAVADYDSANKLDAWKSSILLRIKNTIKGEESQLT